MAKNTPQEIYKAVKKKNTKYNEELHCVMVLKCFSEGGTMSTFCSQAMIGDTTFWDWNRRYTTFNECYRIAYMLGKEKWQKEGRDNKDNDEFNMEYWKLIGLERYGLGRNPKIRMGVKHNANPYEQYQQLVKLGNQGEFTSSEFKQLMEAINVGIRAHENYKLQDEIDEMKANLALMEANSNGGNTVPVESAKEAN
jgi:hypothetical protein